MKNKYQEALDMIDGYLFLEENHHEFDLMSSINKLQELVDFYRDCETLVPVQLKQIKKGIATIQKKDAKYLENLVEIESMLNEINRELAKNDDNLLSKLKTRTERYRKRREEINEKDI